jgi:hypothetical protein
MADIQRSDGSTGTRPVAAVLVVSLLHVSVHAATVEIFVAITACASQRLCAAP